MQPRATSAIIEFPQDRVRPCAADGPRGSAEVLIFTGVRIERMYDLAERLPARAKGGEGDRW